MKRSLRTIVFLFVFLFTLPQTALAAQLLIPGGQLVGLELSNDTVTVAAFDDIFGANARESGLQIGDQLLSIDNRTVTTAEDVRRALADAGDPVRITLLREGKRHILHVSPTATAEGRRLGVYLRQGIAGIGTITFYDPESRSFGALGHGVNDPRGNLLAMTRGLACDASVASVKKGKSGDPGQLRGNARVEAVWGEIRKNTHQGIFGTCKAGLPGQPLPVAEYEDIRPGAATIRSTVAGDSLREYSVEIVKIYPRDRADCRNFLIRITDPMLLEATGGIVQGMSGSPIIQDGKLIGAVTHVLVNDPTTGYGIFIENMLDAAE